MLYTLSPWTDAVLYVGVVGEFGGDAVVLVAVGLSEADGSIGHRIVERDTAGHGMFNLYDISIEQVVDVYLFSGIKTLKVLLFP